MQPVYGPVLAYHIFAKARALVDPQYTGDATGNTANHAANRSASGSSYLAAFFCAARCTPGTP